MDHILIAYHAHCADGYGAYYSVMKKYPRAKGVAMEYAPGAFDAITQELHKYDWVPGEVTLFIVDFSVPNEDLARLMEAFHQVIWIDHHQGAIDRYLQNGKSLYDSRTDPDSVVSEDGHVIILDTRRSGAYLTHQYLFGKVPFLIELLDDYDRWQFKVEYSKAFQRYLWTRTPWSISDWKMLEERVEDIVQWERVVELGQVLTLDHTRKVSDLVKKGKMLCTIPVPHEFGSTRVEQVVQGMAANCPPFLSSDVGHALAVESGTFGLCWFLTQDGLVKLSFRSNSDFDVNQLAQAFGGAGHPRASGATITMEELMKWLKVR